MGLGSFFAFRSANRIAAVSNQSDNADTDAEGMVRVAFPSWSIPGIRVVADDVDIEKTNRREIENLFAIELSHARVITQLSQREKDELALARLIRKALYQDRVAA